MDEQPQNFVAVVGDGLAWSFVLIPLALGALLFGLPHFLEVLGWVCDGMRAFAHAVK